MGELPEGVPGSGLATSPDASLRAALRAAVLLVALLPAAAAAQEPDSAAAPAAPDSAAPTVQRAEPGNVGGIAEDAALATWLSDSVRVGADVPPEARDALELALAEGATVVHGDFVVPRDSAFADGLLVLEGTLRFAGRTPGHVVVVGGDFFLRPGAHVGGDVTVIGGGYYGSGLGVVEGRRVAVRDGRVRVARQGSALEVTGRPEERPFPVALRGVYGFLPEGYNRVDGLALRWGVRYVPAVDRPETLRLSAEAVLRTSRDDLGWLAAAEREFPRRRLTLRASWYNVTDTGERWHRGDVETSLSAFFLGEDNRFYFDRQGIELLAAQEVRGPLALDVALRNDEYRSIAVQDPLTIVEDDFLPNPPVPPGTMRSVLGGATLEHRDDPEVPRRGWWARLEGEAAGGLVGGDYGFTSGRLDLRRYQPVGPHRLALRLVVGGRIGGTLPQQRRYHLGGAGTLPGYEALSVRGDRAAIVNLRYRIPVDVLRFGPWRDGAWITLLGDAGDAWEHDDDPHWVASGGIGVAGRGALEEVGVYVVVPTEQIAEDQSDVSVFLYFGSFF